MNITLLSWTACAQTAVVLTAALMASLSGCTNIKDDSQRTRTEGALTGAAVGGLAGAAAGDSVAKKKEGYARQESALDSQLAGLNRQIEARQKYNAGVREFVSARERQLATVLASDRSEGLTVAEFDLRTSVNAEVGKVDRTARSWQETIDAHRAVLKGASADARGPELEAEITRLTAERTELLRQRARLISINEKLAK